MFLLTICSGRQLAVKCVHRTLGDGAEAIDSEDLEEEGLH